MSELTELMGEVLSRTVRGVRRVHGAHVALATSPRREDAVIDGVEASPDGGDAMARAHLASLPEGEREQLLERAAMETGRRLHAAAATLLEAKDAARLPVEHHPGDGRRRGHHRAGRLALARVSRASLVPVVRRAQAAARGPMRASSRAPRGSRWSRGTGGRSRRGQHRSPWISGSTSRPDDLDQALRPPRAPSAARPSRRSRRGRGARGSAASRPPRGTRAPRPRRRCSPAPACRPSG